MIKDKGLTALFLFSLALGAARSAQAACAEGSDLQYCADHEGDQDESDLLSSEAETESPLQPPKPGRGEAHPLDALVRNGLGDGNWGVEIELFDRRGGVQLLSQMNGDTPLMPASTMKIFTSWLGFVEDRAKPRTFPPPYNSFESYAATMLKFSVNEMAFKMLSLYGGASAMERFYAHLGLPVQSFHVADGAGLSVKNRATARLEASVLKRILSSGRYQAYRQLLAEPGEAGTLKNRLLDLRGQIFAKTGTLTVTRVAALAGFMDVGERGTIVFSIIGNSPKIDVDLQHARIDRTIEAVHRVYAKPRFEVDAALAVLRQKDFASRLPSSLVFP